MKICYKCDTFKELSEFSKKKNTPDGLRTYCRACQTSYAANRRKLLASPEARKRQNQYMRDRRRDNPEIRERELRSGREWRINNPEKARASSARGALKNKFGITPEDKLRMFSEQGGCCCICKNAFLTLASACVDHVHNSDPIVVRGLLCITCNWGLGHFQDSSHLLESADAYLKKAR